jgi:hypothetical protein
LTLLPTLPHQVLVPAANEGRLPLRVYSFVPLPTW